MAEQAEVEALEAELKEVKQQLTQVTRDLDKPDISEEKKLLLLLLEKEAKLSTKLERLSAAPAGAPSSSGAGGSGPPPGAASAGAAPGPVAGGQLDLILQTLATSLQTLATNQQAIQQTLATNQQAVLELIRTSSEDRQSASLSGLDMAKWQEIKAHAHLHEELSVVAPPAPNPVVIDSFGWDDRHETTQADRYMPHLARVLPLQTREATWARGDSMPGLCNVDPPAAPFDMRGKCDAAVLTRAAKLSHNYATGLLVLFELKKKVEPRHLYQAQAQLFAANIRCPNSRPFVVLTDLNSSWTILYLDGLSVCTVATDCAADAVYLIQCLVAESLARLAVGASSAADCSAAAGPSGAPVDSAGGDQHAALKRRRLDLPAAGAFQGVASADIANLADLEGVLSDEEYRRLLLEQALYSMLRRPGMREHFGVGPESASAQEGVKSPIPGSPPPYMYL